MNEEQMIVKDALKAVQLSGEHGQLKSVLLDALRTPDGQKLNPEQQSVIWGTLTGRGWISGNTLTTILSILCGAGGIVGGKMWGDRSTKKREEEIRAQIANELRAKIVNDPLHVSKVQNCVSIGECNRRMKDLDERVTRLEGKFDSGIGKIMDKLSAMDRESEQRAVALHRRMDAISEKTSETAGVVEMIKGKMFKRS